MSLSIYMDAHVKSAVTRGLRQRGVTVMTAQEDGTDTFIDPDLLDRVTQLGYVLFTQDADFLVEGARRQGAGEAFGGIVYAHQLRVSIRQCIDDLELLGKTLEPADMLNRIEYLPL
jgi:predicted nuclease of predicted toxin-antitoxin system